MSLQGIRGLAKMKAALAVAMVMGAAALAPAPGSRRISPVPNIAGERLLPRRRKPLRQPDPERIEAAEARRARKAEKRLANADADAGGWASTGSWLAVVYGRRAAAQS